MKKTVLQGILASTLMLSLTTVSQACDIPAGIICTQTLAASMSGEGDFWFTEGTITSYNGDEAELLIPCAIDGADISSIGHFSFSGRTALIAAAIPDSVDSIGNGAFSYCPSLLSLTIPSSVKGFGENIFIGSEQVTIYGEAGSPAEAFAAKEGLTFVAEINSANTQTLTTSDYSFENGVITKYNGEGGEVEIPSSINGEAVTEIGESAFDGVTTLTSVIIPDSVTTIGDYAFFSAYGLESVTMGDSVTTIGDSAFGDCPELLTIHIPASVVEFGETNIFSDSKAVTVTVESGSVAEEYLTSHKVSFEVAEESADVEEDYADVEEDSADVEEDSADVEEESADVEEESADVEEEVVNKPLPSVIFHDWALEHIQFANNNDLLLESLGMEYTDDISRLQIAHLLVNMVEKYTKVGLAPSSETFSDTDDLEVLKAYAAGIISGKGEGIFDPDAPATRQEISIMIYNTIKIMEESTETSLITHEKAVVSGYSDFETTAFWAQEPLAILVNNQLMTGADNQLFPLNNTTIQECIVLTNNLFKLK